MHRNLKTITAVAAVGLTAGSAAAQTSGPKAVYWLSAETSSGMGGMGGMMGGAGNARAAAMAQARAQSRAQPAPDSGYVGSNVGGVLGSEVGGRSGLGGFVGGQMGSALGGMFGKKKKGQPQQQPQAEAEAPAPAPAMAGYTHNLTLQLGSRQKPTGAPSAEHLPPAGLQVGPSLPLNTPTNAAASPAPYGRDFDGSNMHGKMLIYWGCGEHAAAPPITIDFATMRPGGAMPKFPTVTVNAPQPPNASQYLTYGDWPNVQSGANSVPANGSLVGAHTVRVNYSPEIHFGLDGSHDFLAPLRVRSGASGAAGGGTSFSWNQVPGATGYFAWLMGGGGGPDGSTVVLWTSSATAAFMGGLMDYLPPAEVRRLVVQRTVLAPTTTQCTVPAEVVQASPAGLLSMIAYGDEVNVSDPPRPASPKSPWNLSYTVKARFKSTASTMLGVPGMGD